MIFTSVTFIIILALTVSVYYVLKHRFRWILLLSVSYFLYYNWCPQYFPLLLTISLLTYAGGIAISRSSRKRTIYLTTVFSVLGAMVFFKYHEFLFQLIPGLQNMITGVSPPLIEKIILPLGISFFSFQCISYIVDVYKKRIEPEYHPGHLLLFVSFFPQLVSGPIEKANYLIPEIKRKQSFQYEHLFEGGKLMLMGFFKKIVIADTIATITIPGFQNIQMYSGIDLWLLNLLFAYYIYADFSGYSDIALGSARMFGIKLSINFFKPFSSKNMREFWSRWHITLFTWLKDYVFFSNGSLQRKSKATYLVRIFLVFIAVGLWHGGTINYLSYGALAGGLVVFSHLTKKKRNQFEKKLRQRLSQRNSGFSSGALAGSIVLGERLSGGENKSTISDLKFNLAIKGFDFLQKFMVVIQFSLLADFFAIARTEDALYAYQHLFSASTFNIPVSFLTTVFILVLILETLQYFQKENTLHPFGGIKSISVRFAIYLIMVFSILLLSNRDIQTFAYFQF